MDWWSLGILIFELTVGVVPFFDTSNTAIYKKITDAPLMMASWIPNNAQDLIRALLQRDVTQRLGWKHDVDDIKKHEWFDDVDWIKIFDKDIEPPYKPEIDQDNDEADLTNVADKFRDEKACDNYVEEKPKLNEQELFRGFTLRGQDADEVRDIFGGGSTSMSTQQVQKLILQKQRSDGSEDDTQQKNGKIKIRINKHTLANLSLMDSDFAMMGLQEAPEDTEEEEEEEERGVGPLQEEDEEEEEEEEDYGLRNKD